MKIGFMAVRLQRRTLMLSGERGRGGERERERERERVERVKGALKRETGTLQKKELGLSSQHAGLQLLRWQQEHPR